MNPYVQLLGEADRDIEQLKARREQLLREGETILQQIRQIEQARDYIKTKANGAGKHGFAAPPTKAKQVLDLLWEVSADFSKKKLKDAIVEVLRHFMRRMKTYEIAKELLDHGFQTGSSENFSMVCYSSMVRNPEIFNNRDKSWGLNEWETDK